MEKSKKSINVEGGFLFCGGWNFSKSVSVGSTFIREMRVLIIEMSIKKMLVMKQLLLILNKGRISGNKNVVG